MAMTRQRIKNDSMILRTIEELVPKNHLIRKLDECIDLHFIEDEVENLNPITQTRRKNSAGSSLNLRSKKIKGILKKKDKDELKKPLYRRMSYNDNNSNRFLVIKNFKEEELENSNISINEI